VNSVLRCCDRYRAVAKTNTRAPYCVQIRLRKRDGIAIALGIGENQFKSYRRQFLMVTRATVTSSKTVDFSFRGPFGFEAHTVLLSVDGDSPNQYAFESVGGNISLMGIVDFAEIRPHCSEVTLAVHYEIKNKLFAWLDRRLHFVDSFVTAELRSIRAHFEGIRSSYLERPRVMPVLQAAHA
jgi:hypothetical protein